MAFRLVFAVPDDEKFRFGSLLRIKAGTGSRIDLRRKPGEEDRSPIGPMLDYFRYARTKSIMSSASSLGAVAGLEEGSR